MVIKNIEEFNKVFIEKSTEFMNTFKKVASSKSSGVHIFNDTTDVIEYQKKKYPILCTLYKHDSKWDIDVCVFNEDDDSALLEIDEKYDTKVEFKTTVVKDLQNIFLYRIKEELVKFGLK